MPVLCSPQSQEEKPAQHFQPPCPALPAGERIKRRAVHRPLWLSPHHLLAPSGQSHLCGRPPACPFELRNGGVNEEARAGQGMPSLSWLEGGRSQPLPSRSGTVTGDRLRAGPKTAHHTGPGQGREVWSPLRTTSLQAVTAWVSEVSSLASAPAVSYRWESGLGSGLRRHVPPDTARAAMPAQPQGARANGGNDAGGEGG